MNKSERKQQIRDSLGLDHICDFAVKHSSKIGKQWIPYRHLQFVADKIEQAIRTPGSRLAISMPVRHGKSELMSRWTPAWFLENFPEETVILGSYGFGIAKKWGRRVRDMFDDPELRTNVRRDKSLASNWETTQRGGMITGGIGSGITGEGGRLLLLDDPIKDWASAHSPVVRESTKEWYLSTFITRAEPGASVIVNATRWHSDDLIGWLLRESTEKWDYIALPAIAEDNDPLGREPGEALCPERYNEEALEKVKRRDSRVWAGMYQQRPVPSEGSIIKREWLKFYTKRPDLSEFDALIQSWDTSFKDSVGTDPVSGDVWGRKRGDFYLLDHVKENANYPRAKQMLRTMTDLWPMIRAKIVEDKANGPAIISDLKHEIPGLIAYSPKDSKEARCNAVSPLFESGNVYIPSTSLASWVPDWIDEITSFPSASHDDQVDSMTQALIRLSRRAKGSPFLGGGDLGEDDLDGENPFLR